MAKIELIQGDCLERMKDIPDGSVDAIVTDPPYGLSFMGKNWDKGVPGVEFWIEMLRVLKHGGYLLSFSGTRTYHRMAVAIEDAGFEIRDMIEWVYGSGFPKSLNIGKAVDKLQGNEREDIGEKIYPDGKIRPNIYSSKDSNDGWKRPAHLNYSGNRTDTKGTSEWEGWGTALKPAHEPICMARKPLAEKTVAENVLKHGTGGINIDESRVASSDDLSLRYKSSFQEGNSQFVSETATHSGKRMELKQPEGAKLGRFPANLIHDNSEEVRECFPETKGGGYQNGSIMNTKKTDGFLGGKNIKDGKSKLLNDDGSGNASRFFKSIIYQAKASKSERNKGCEDMGGNKHCTVKPVALMEYLTCMVTKEGGTVLDPFMGSGTTGVACKNLNRNFIGIELDPEYFKIAKKRINENL